MVVGILKVQENHIFGVMAARWENSGEEWWRIESVSVLGKGEAVLGIGERWMRRRGARGTQNSMVKPGSR